MEQVKKNKKFIIGGAIATAVLALGYWLLKTDKDEVKQEDDNTNKQQKKTQEDQSNQQFQGLTQNEESKQEDKEKKKANASNQQSNLLNAQESDQKKKKLQEILKKIKVQYYDYPNDKVLQFETIQEIFENSIEIAEQEYVNITMHNRAERRQYMDNPDVYEKLILSYNDELENVLSKAQEEIAENLGISKEKYEESVVNLIETGGPQLFQKMYMLNAAIRQKIKEKIPSKKTLDAQQIKSLIEYQVKILKEKSDYFEVFLSKLKGQPETAQQIPFVLNTIISDFIYQKFEVEEEDQMAYMMNIQFEDPEIINLTMQIEDAMFKLMMKCGMEFGMGGGGGGMPMMPPGDFSGDFSQSWGGEQ